MLVLSLGQSIYETAGFVFLAQGYNVCNLVNRQLFQFIYVKIHLNGLSGSASLNCYPRTPVVNLLLSFLSNQCK